MANIKAVLKDIKHYGTKALAPGADDFCEVVYGPHTVDHNNVVEAEAGCIYISSDKNDFGFDPFTPGQKRHSKTLRIITVNEDGTREYRYVNKMSSAKAVLVALAAGLDIDLFEAGIDFPVKVGRMLEVQRLIKTAKAGK